MKKEKLQEIIRLHGLWLQGDPQGKKANLSRANLSRADLSEANLSGANLSRANLSRADLSRADLSRADLSRANLSEANLSRANLSEANLYRADLSGANLSRADLSRANLYRANLSEANLSEANLSEANLYRANLSEANLSEAENMIKIMGVEPGNFYWKRFDNGLNNNNFQFHVGLNKLPNNETFADDDRIICSYPGFHFASRSWCKTFYPERPLEARIQIPKDAKINEPWGTDGKASADSIIILQVFDTITGEDVTDKYRKRRTK